MTRAGKTLPFPSIKRDTRINVRWRRIVPIVCYILDLMRRGNACEGPYTKKDIQIQVLPMYTADQLQVLYRQLR